MQKPERIILSTRPLPEGLVAEAAAQGLHIDTVSFIDTEPATDAETRRLVQVVATAPGKVVFTSMNAVEAVAQQLTQLPRWEAFCIGHATKKLLTEQIRVPVIGDAPDADALASVIIASGVKSVAFFCGDQRRDALPLRLGMAGIRVHEIIVYRTIATPHPVDKAYDGLLFYSPSAVESFFEVNGAPAGAVFFAIGATTAAAIREHCANTIIVADEPGKEALTRKMMAYFSTFTTTSN
ncbi:uroporphyrinogen-III synthase [Flaviaesturariibacter amylovorans]|uniref:Tetrapyrrole biosynthesis uroporphyrinogen III synthase domain-containing protein n=1 Tax=Flaviaesturariibacter amylovorans TaxID=1084520 RepID=A0ABP8G626_9BACT